MIRVRWPPRDVAMWIALGLGIREAFGFWTGHPFDMEIWLRNAYFVAHGWNPYSFMPPVPGVSFAYTGQDLPSVAYLPLWPLVLAGFYDLFAAVPGGGRFLLIWLVKQPPILGDALVGVLLFMAGTRWGASRSTAMRLLVFWMLFPYAILVSAIWGQFDSLVAALVIASLLAASSSRRSVGLGVGILLKYLPVVYVPFLVLRSRGRDRWASLLAVAVPVGFTAAVFAATGWTLGGLSGTLGSEVHSYPQGLSWWTLIGVTGLGNLGTASTLLGAVLSDLWVPVVLVGSWWAARRFAGGSPEGTLQAFVFLTVLLFLFRWMVNEQYLIELVPLLLLDTALWHPERRGLLHATWILGFVFLVWNNFFLVRFGAPAFPGALPFEFTLQNDPTFGAVRGVVLHALGVLFSIHLVQLALVLSDPDRPTTPWVARPLRWAWSRPLHRTRATTPGREG